MIAMPNPEVFKLGLATLDRVRATVGAAACGMATRALSEALTHAKSRQQFGRPIADFQLIQEKLARMATDLTAARLLVYRAAWEKDKGALRVTLEAAMAKSFATEAAQRIVDDAVQILGEATEILKESRHGRRQHFEMRPLARRLLARLWLRGWQADLS